MLGLNCFQTKEYLNCYINEQTHSCVFKKENKKLFWQGSALQTLKSIKRVLEGELSYTSSLSDEEMKSSLRNTARQITETYESQSNRGGIIQKIIRVIYKVFLKRDLDEELKEIKCLNTSIQGVDLFKVLNDDVLGKILPYLDLSGQAKMASVNRQGQNLASNSLFSKAQQSFYEGKQAVKDMCNFLSSLRDELFNLKGKGILPESCEAATKQEILDKLDQASFADLKSMVCGMVDNRYCPFGIELDSYKGICKYLFKKIEKEAKTNALLEEDRQLLNQKLDQALHNRHYHLALLLLQLGASATDATDSGIIEKVLNYHGYSDYKKIDKDLLTFLFDKGFSTQIAKKGWKVLGNAVRNRDLEAVREFLDCGVSPFSGDSSAIDVASKEGSKEVIQLILDHPKLSDQREKAARAIIDYCFFYDQWDALASLKLQGFSDKVNLRGRHALDGAIINQKIERIGKLLNFGIDPFKISAVNLTTSKAVVQYILDHPSLAARRNEYAKKIIEECFNHKRWDILECLKQNGFSDQIANAAAGSSRLEEAVRQGDIESINVLLNFGVNPFSLMMMEQTGIHGSEKAIKALLDHPALFGRREEAAQIIVDNCSRFDVLAFLHEEGFSAQVAKKEINAKSLLAAIDQNAFEGIDWLFKQGVDPFADGMAAMKHAGINGSTVAIALILSQAKTVGRLEEAKEVMLQAANERTCDKAETLQFLNRYRF